MKIPDYINEKKNIVRLVAFTSIFALVFINIYKPFSSYNWYPVSEFMFFVYSSIIILTGVLVVIISRLIMYFYGKKHEISYWKYAFWVFFEILFMSLFYTIYTLSVGKERDIMEIFKTSIINTSLVLLLPYTVLWFYFGWRESILKLEKLSQKKQSGATLFGNIPFYDEKGVLRISISKDDLLYIESCDNYVTIHYTGNNKVNKYLLRNRLKTIENQLLNTNITRCHRTFLVNLEKAKVIRKESDGLYIELDTKDAKEIPVSKSYQKKISEKFIS
ncbi:MAG: LytTR family DNA-binding domain-containing protein [Bacteroidales bacterium]